MQLDNLFEDLRCAGVVPDPLWENDGDRSFGTDSKAVRLGPVNQRLRSDQFQFFQTLLQKLPRTQAVRMRAALGFALISTEENMPLVLFNAELCDNFVQRVHGVFGTEKA